MRVFRLSRKKYASVLSGEGAAKSGNRWNSKGIEVVYCAESRALAMAEVLVHVSLAMLPLDYVMLEIDIPEQIQIKTIKISELPEGWSAFPHSVHSQKVGDKFIAELEFCIQKVPSAIVKGDFNVLINPRHEDFAEIKIISMDDFPFDPRLFK